MKRSRLSPFFLPPFFLLKVPFLRVNGMALFPFILVREGKPSARLLNHERIHHRQQLELLILPFYVWYLLEYAWHRLRGLSHHAAYLAIRFEREAYRHDGEADYLKRRKWWAFLRE